VLEGGKKLRKRAEPTRTQRNTGPDICVKNRKRRIWIEAMAPDQGDETNLDQVPPLKSGLADPKNSPRRQIELRITHALRTKAKKFAGYREQGIIDEKDSCIVAVSASRFPYSLQEVFDLPPLGQFRKLLCAVMRPDRHQIGIKELLSSSRSRQTIRRGGE
jgi:hypothetical protein